ncbi:hypothetical protein PY364_01215, partial [Kamptonema sp. UHCC 0994]|nr:hypothetical protein [Kamptonema sp. UHCC 0994]
ETEWEWPYVAYKNVDTEIQSGFLSYIRIGYFLDRMRYHKLYKTQGFKSFKDYCLKALRKSANYCTKIICAAQVCLNLAAAGFEQLPNCVAQALPLVKFNTVDEYGNSTLAEKWQKVLDETPPNQPITSTQITEILDETPPETKPQQVKLKAETYAKLEKIAKAKGITVREVIDELADLLLNEIEAEPTPVTPEKQAEWEADLEALIIEQVDWVVSESNESCINDQQPRPGSMPDSS